MPGRFERQTLSDGTRTDPQSEQRRADMGDGEAMYLVGVVVLFAVFGLSLAWAQWRAGDR